MQAILKGALLGFFEEVAS